MTRRILEQSDVNAAADTLVTEGKKPTIGLIYEKVDRRGSNSTIQKMLAIWEASQATTAQSSTQPEIPASVMDALRAMGEKLVLEVYKASKVQTDAEIAVIVDGLKAQQAKLREDLETASKIEADRERDLLDAEKALTETQVLQNQVQQNLAASEAREQAAQIQVRDLTSHTREQSATIATQAERLGSLQANLDAATQKIRDLETRIHELENKGKK